MVTGNPESETDKFLRLLLLLSLIISVVFIWRYTGKILDGETCFAPDFQVFYHAALFFKSGAALYSNDVQSIAGICGQGKYYPYVYPPYSVFIFWPLQFFSYEAARMICLGFEIALWFLVLNAPSVRALWPRLALKKNYLFVPVILSMPTLINVVFTGQMGIFFASVLVYGIANIKDRPKVAGIVLSLMAIKPTLAFLLLLFLVAGKHFKVLVSSGVCVGLLCMITVMMWGIPLWLEWLASVRFITSIYTWVDLPANFVSQMISPFVGFRIIGLSPQLASVLQLMISCIAMLAVCIAAYRIPYNSGILLLLLTSTLAANAYVWQYDAVLSTAILMLLVEGGYQRPLSPSGRIIIIMAVFSGMVTIQLQALGIPYGSLVVLALWGLALYNVFSCNTVKKPLNII